MIIYIVMWNLIVFLIYATDKMKAVRGSFRISEKFLISCAFLMGAYGAFCGMYILRHKTRKMKFRLLIPVAVILNSAVLYCLGIK